VLVLVWCGVEWCGVARVVVTWGDGVVWWCVGGSDGGVNFVVWCMCCGVSCGA
jgi:hypothetical protein